MVWNVHLHGSMSNNTRVLFPHCCNFFNSLSPLHFLPPPFFPLLLLLLILLLLMGVSLLLLWADLDLFLLVSSFTGLPPANHRLKLIIQVHIPNCPKIWNNEFDLKGSLLHLIKRERVQNSFDYHGGSEVTSFTLKKVKVHLSNFKEVDDISWVGFGKVRNLPNPRNFFFKCFKCSLRNAKCIFPQTWCFVRLYSSWNSLRLQQSYQFRF